MQCSCEARGCGSSSVTPSRLFVCRRTSRPGRKTIVPECHSSNRQIGENIYCGDEGNVGCMGRLVPVQGSCTKCRCRHGSRSSKHGKKHEIRMFFVYENFG